MWLIDNFEGFNENFVVFYFRKFLYLLKFYLGFKIFFLIYIGIIKFVFIEMFLKEKVFG